MIEGMNVLSGFKLGWWARAVAVCATVTAASVLLTGGIVTAGEAVGSPKLTELILNGRADVGSTETLKLRGASARQQLLATAKLTNGLLRDVTRQVSYEAIPAKVLRIEKDGL